ncbi:MAG: hypothetical protein LBQ31_05860 [Bacteroidales bacterium]|nr:hypothetical protein [Bacteroidales bacterium]
MQSLTQARTNERRKYHNIVQPHHRPDHTPYPTTRLLIQSHTQPNAPLHKQPTKIPQQLFSHITVQTVCPTPPRGYSYRTIRNLTHHCINNRRKYHKIVQPHHRPDCMPHPATRLLIQNHTQRPRRQTNRHDTSKTTTYKTHTTQTTHITTNDTSKRTSAKKHPQNSRNKAEI